MLIATPILFMVQGKLIPIRHSEALQKLNPGKITLIRIHGGGHNNLPNLMNTTISFVIFSSINTILIIISINLRLQIC